MDKKYIDRVLNLVDAELMPAGSDDEIWEKVEKEMEGRWTGDWREDVKLVLEACFGVPWDAEEESADLVRQLLEEEIDLEQYDF